MLASGSHLETEVKLRADDPGELFARLAGAGFTCTKPRVFETNTLYDTPDEALHSAGIMLRIRIAEDVCTITYKGAADQTNRRYKVRPEIEFTASDATAADALLRSLGYRPAFQYEKYRTEYGLTSHPEGVLTVDETPVGLFVELEGTPEWIDSAAEVLGYSTEQYITSTYVEIYVEDCKRAGILPTALTFPQGKTGR
jgi:adenylate cyclase, class 2